MYWSRAVVEPLPARPADDFLGGQEGLTLWFCHCVHTLLLLGQTFAGISLEEAESSGEPTECLPYSLDLVWRSLIVPHSIEMFTDIALRPRDLIKSLGL